MADALVPLYSTTLATSTTSLAISGIPSTYRDLYLSVTGLSTSGEMYFYLYFNSDTGANYSRVEASGNGSTTGSSASSNLIPITLRSDAIGTTTINIMDYSATDKHKTVLYRNGNSANVVLMGAGRWANTAAINTVTITGYSTGTMATGCTISLYGILS